MSELEHFSTRAERVLAKTFRGLHHCPDIHKANEGGEFEHWWVNTWETLSTFDFDGLTRLVVSAHDECIRAQIMSSGPRMVKIMLHNRKGRDGGFAERHPTIEDAILEIRSRT